MLENATIIATLPVTDLARAKAFYVDTLGLNVMMEDPVQRIVIVRGGGTMLELAQHDAISSGDHTCAIFMLGDDFDAVVDGLIARGLTFAVKDLPHLGLEWDERGVGRMRDQMTAWFKDPDGNVLQLYAREGKQTGQ